MDPSFLFLLILVLLAALATISDLLSWNKVGKVLPPRKRKRPKPEDVLCKGSVEERKRAEAAPTPDSRQT